VDLDLAQLRALSAVVSAGTFDAAARALHVTPSAISQRLKALEAAAGRVLVVRSKPVRVTASGQVVLRLARQVEVLTADTARHLGTEHASRPITLPIVVNADSLATWVLPALAPGVWRGYVRMRALVDCRCPVPPRPEATWPVWCVARLTLSANLG